MNRFEIFNKADSTADLYLYGDIGGWWADINSEKVREKLAQLSEKTSEINVYLKSNGGDVFESIAIKNILSRHSAKINVYIDGMAASGGSVIAMAGDNIYMYPDSMMMIHNPWTIAWGNKSDFLKVAEDLEKIEASLRGSYKARINCSEEDLSALLDAETMLTADECFELNLCDEILESDDGNNSEDSAVQGILKNKTDENKYNPSDNKAMISNAFKQYANSLNNSNEKGE